MIINLKVNISYFLEKIMCLLAGVLSVSNKLLILTLQVMMIQKWKMTVQSKRNLIYIHHYIFFSVHYNCHQVKTLFFFS